MIYRLTFTFKADANASLKNVVEADKFKRVFEADPYATFLDLHNAILESVGYPNDQMTSFLICNDGWEVKQEVTLMDMGGSYEEDTYVMEDTHLDDLITEPKQKLLYVFDPMFERTFDGRLTEIISGKSMSGVKCVEKAGKAPQQLQQDDTFANVGGKDLDLGEDFYGDSQYDQDELDMDGYSDLSFEDGTMF